MHSVFKKFVLISGALGGQVITFVKKSTLTDNGGKNEPFMSMLPPIDITPVQESDIELEEEISPLSFKDILEKKGEEKPAEEKKQEKKKEALPSVFTIDMQAAHIPSPSPFASAEIKGISLVDFSDVAKALETHLTTLTIKDEIASLKTTYQKEGSPFNGLEIFIDHYSIAPSEFHIEFYGNPQAAQFLHLHQETLALQLSSTLSGHTFHIAPPFIAAEGKLHYRKEKKRESGYIKKSKQI